MADKTAQIKLTLKSDGFKSGLSDADKEAKKAAKSMGDSFSSALSKAGSEGFSALKSTLGSLKSAMLGFAGVAGGFGVVELGRRAIEQEGSFRKLSFQIKAGTGDLVRWKDLQTEAQQTALKYGHTTEEVGKSISDLYAAVGDPKFARDASKVVAEVATGAHESLESMTALAGGLNEKFGVTAEQLPDVLASVVSLGNKGGVSVQDLADKIGIIGANAKGVGLDGAKGFGTMVSWLNIADNATGTLKKGITGVTGIIEGLSGDTLKKPLMQNLGIDVDKIRKGGGDFNAVVGEIMKKTGGKEGALAKVFSGDQLKVMAEVGRTYAATFEATKGDVQTKTAAALHAYDDALKQAGKSNLSAADIQAEAAAAMETPEMKIKTALEKMAQELTKPQFLDAFKKLADFLPKIIDQMIKHPLLTGAALSGLPQAILGSLLKSMGGIGSGGPKDGFMGGGLGPSLQKAAPALAAVGAGGLLGKAIIDHFIDQSEKDTNYRIGADAELGDTIANSRTMALDKGGADVLAASLDQAIAAKQQQLDERSASKQETDSYLIPGMAGFRDFARGIFGGAREETGPLMQGNLAGDLSDLRQAKEDLEVRVARAQGGPGSLGLVHGDELEQYQLTQQIGRNTGLGSFGDPHAGETRKERAAREAAEKKDQAVSSASESVGNQAIAKAIAGQTLKVQLLNPGEITGPISEAFAKKPKE